MKINYLVAPKKLPSAVTDPGIWWDILSQDKDIELTYSNHKR